ncbi:hypothetical protein [Thermocatellispora tengchongensis]|uniref:hypothetical protein n=1 Tax=Thermocatellispora tengchongensis TaxID=1073253 RepID=UPI003630CA98
MRNLRLRGRERLVNGTFCVTGRNIDGKRYERLFFTEPGQEPKVLHPADTWDDLLAHWNALRCSAETSESWPDLAEGTLCYAYREPESTKVSRLYPVLVPRDLSPVSPAEMLDPSIAPAACLGELSPADRVFGWVAPEASGVRPAAYKGRLRIGPVICDDDATPRCAGSTAMDCRWRSWGSRNRSKDASTLPLASTVPTCPSRTGRPRGPLPSRPRPARA